MNRFCALVLLAAMLSTGCGGGEGDSPDTDRSVIFYEPIIYPGNARLVKFRFTATIDMINGTPPFPVSIGDNIWGLFSYDPTVNDSYVSPTEGGYPQTAPAYVQIMFNSITINADLSSGQEYYIDIFDNDSSADPIRDTFMWSIEDTNLAGTYGIDRIGTTFHLDDLTATVFNSDALPVSLDLNNFSNGFVFVTGATVEVPYVNILWHFRSQIISITKE